MNAIAHYLQAQNLLESIAPEDALTVSEIIAVANTHAILALAGVAALSSDWLPSKDQEAWEVHTSVEYTTGGEPTEDGNK